MIPVINVLKTLMRRRDNVSNVGKVHTTTLLCKDVYAMNWKVTILMALNLQVVSSVIILPTLTLTSTDAKLVPTRKSLTSALTNAKNAKSLTLTSTVKTVMSVLEKNIGTGLKDSVKTVSKEQHLIKNKVDASAKKRILIKSMGPNA